MTILKANDKVKVKAGAYNVADHRYGREAVVTRIDSDSKLLPVRIEYPDTTFNWTNYESLELVEVAPINHPHAEIGKDILDKMVILKESIITRDNAVKLVVEQTEALDALLASVGLKRGEEIPAIPVRVAAGPRTVLDDLVDKTVKEGMRYRCTSDDFDYFTNGKIYQVVDLDLRDSNQPVSFEDDDDDDYFPERHELKYFERVI